ncbi:MAG: LeuA family protein [Thermoanaerobaculia bacterium]|nr:LeuA family protein [Thermoanaerobaculia bacterium]
MSFTEGELIHDWNRAEEGDLTPARSNVEVNDETLRDGLQSPSAISPSIRDKIEILHGLAEAGVDALDLGLPGAGDHVVADVTALAEEIVRHDLPLGANCAARTLASDIHPVVEISQTTGLEIEVACFLGSSPIRQYAEGWEMDRMLRLTDEAVSLAVDEGLPVMYVTEDTTRAQPEDLRRLYTAAVEAGARRICIADTVGHATPHGARHVTGFVRDVVDATGEEVSVDWHGHRDRGFSLINALASAEAGADRLHGTVLGLGERVGNSPLELLLVNLVLLGWRDSDLSSLPGLCRKVAETTGVPFPDNWPVFGADAFRTGTGVHASAIIKAREKGDDWLADRIYSGVPAGLVGRRQQIEIGPMSGVSNIVYWLQERGIEPEAERVQALFRRAKESDRLLTEEECLEEAEAGRDSTVDV